MRPIVVTGAAGFIGSHLVNRLSSMGYSLILVDSPANFRRTEGIRSVSTAHEEIETARFPKKLEQGDCRPAAIFHLGACSSTTENNWGYLQQNNIEYTQNLWNWCAKSGAAFLYASSAATYGNGSLGFDDRTPPHLLTPLNLYGKSKNEFDIWALNQAASGLSAPGHWAGFKFFNVYGPCEIHKGPMASVVYKGYRQVEREGTIRLYASNHPEWKDGCQERDFVFVEDCIDHMVWHWRTRAQAGIYNSGSGTARTFVDLARAVFAALGREPKIEFTPLPAEIANQYQNHTRAEMGKIVQAGYSGPPTSLEDGVQKSVEGYRQLLKPAESRA